MVQISVLEKKNLLFSLTNPDRIDTIVYATQGTVVQLVRALPCHGRSCGFEPRQSRSLTSNLSMGFKISIGGEFWFTPIVFLII